MIEGERPRILLVEDEGLILLELELAVAELGYNVAGCASQFHIAVDLANTLEIDVALLDVNLAGQASGPIADILDSRNVPFLFASGYTQVSLPPRHEKRPLLPKPFTRAALERELKRVRAGAPNSSLR